MMGGRRGHGRPGHARDGKQHVASTLPARVPIIGAFPDFFKSGKLSAANSR
jgi:hypothetical protein